MSGWFNKKNLTSFAQSALKEAQKRIDKALDIQEEDLINPDAPISSQSFSTPTASAAKNKDSDFWNDWNLDGETGVMVPAAKKSVSTSKLLANAAKADSTKQADSVASPELANAPTPELSTDHEVHLNKSLSPQPNRTRSGKHARQKQPEGELAQESVASANVDERPKPSRNVSRKSKTDVVLTPVADLQSQPAPMTQSLVGDWATTSQIVTAFDTDGFNEVQFESVDPVRSVSKAAVAKIEEETPIANVPSMSQSVTAMARSVVGDWNVEASAIDDQLVTMLNQDQRPVGDSSNPAVESETWNAEELDFDAVTKPDSDIELSKAKRKKRKNKAALSSETPDEAATTGIVAETEQEQVAQAVSDESASAKHVVFELETASGQPDEAMDTGIGTIETSEPETQVEVTKAESSEGCKQQQDAEADNSGWASTSRSTMQESASSTSTLTSLGVGASVHSTLGVGVTSQCEDAGADVEAPDADDEKFETSNLDATLTNQADLTDSMLQSVTSNLDAERRPSESDSAANVDNENIESTSASASASSDRESLSASEPRIPMDMQLQIPDHNSYTEVELEQGSGENADMSQSEQFEKLGHSDSDQADVCKVERFESVSIVSVGGSSKQAISHEIASSGEDYTSSDIEVLSSAASTTGEYVNYGLRPMPLALGSGGGLLVRAPVVARQPATAAAAAFYQHGEPTDRFVRAVRDIEVHDRERQASTSTLIGAPASPPTSESGTGGSSTGNGNGHSSSSEASSSSIVVIGSDRDRHQLAATSPERDDDPDCQRSFRLAEETVKYKPTVTSETSSGASAAGPAVSTERMSRSELIRKVRELTETLNARENKVLELNLELNNHREALDRLESRIHEEAVADQQSLISELQEKLAESNRELEAARRAVQNTEQRNTAKHDAEQLKIITKYEAERRRLVDAVREKDEQIAQFAVEGERLSKREMQLELRLKEIRAKEREATETLQSQTEKLAKQNAELERLRSAIETHKETEQRNAEAIAQLQRVVQKQEKELLRCRGELEDSTEKSRSLQTTLDAAYRELTDARKQLAARETQLAERAAEQLRDERDELAKRVESLRTDSEKRELVLLAQNEDLRAALQRAEIERIAREQQLKRELNDLQIKLQDAESRNEQLSQNVSMATRPILRQLEHLQARLNQQTSAYETLELQSTEKARVLTSQLNAARENEARHDETVSTLQARIAQLELKVSTASQERARLLANLEELEQAKMDAEQKVERLMAKVEAAKERATKSNAEAKRELITVESQLEAERTQVAALQKRIASLEEQLERARSVSVQRERERERDADRSSTGSHNVSVMSPTLMTTSLNLSSNGNVLASPVFASLYESVRGNTSQPIALSVLDGLQAQLKQKDGEIAHLQAEIGALQSSRTALAQELASAIEANESLKDGALQLETLRAEQAALAQRYNEMLTMYGEKVEEANELRLDVADIKELYRSQLEELLKLRSALASNS